MARFALAAMLLLATVPTLGRLVPHGARAAQDGWAALCTATGLKYVQLAASGAQDGHDDGAPMHPGGHDGPDCAYCPLLASLLAVACLLTLLREVAIGAAVSVRRITVARPSPYPCGLGSRGPPLLF